MFSLIITLISIALVAALALATLYYGGDAFTRGNADANAAKVVVQGQQLLAASEYFRAREGRWPDTTDEMVQLGYLNSLPTAQAPVSAAWAAESWRIAAPGQPVFVLNTPNEDVCRSVNVKGYGLDGILPTARPGLIFQCFGDDNTPLRSVASRGADFLRGAADADIELAPEEVVDTEVPSATDQPAWHVPPTTPSGTPGGGGPGPEPDPEPPGPGVVEFEASALSFGNFAFTGSNQPLDTRSFTLTNTGDADGVVGTFSSTADYLVSHSCGTLAAGANCQVSVTYSPQAAGTHNSNLTLSYGTSQTLSVAVSASAQASLLEFRSAGAPVGPSLSAGTRSLGDEWSTFLTIHNTGTVPVSLGASNYSAQAGYPSLPVNEQQWREGRQAGCATIAAGGACTIMLYWTPQGSTPSSSRTWTATTSQGQTLTLAVSGTILYPNAATNPTTVSRSGPSTEQFITLTNSGQGNLRILGFHEWLINRPSSPAYGFQTGDDQFSVADVNCGSTGGVLATGQSCTFVLHFSDYEYGQSSYTETFRITPDNAPVINIPVTYTP